MALHRPSDPTSPLDHEQLLVFDMQRFCLHDGPGIRTVVFLKGCPLRCRWCQNPESVEGRVELAFYGSRCLGCGACVAVCPSGALADGPGGLDRSRCARCGLCAQGCGAEALRLVGWRATPAELLARVEEDRPYFEASGGGVTLSGGEPLAQPAARALLARCREAGLHTVVETCGEVRWQVLADALPHIDDLYFDLKAGGAELHRACTGRDGARIRANARRLGDSDARVTFRMPVVPGENDSPESLADVAALLRSMGHAQLHLLRYHDGGEPKRRRLGQAAGMRTVSPDRAQRALLEAERRLRALSITVTRDADAPTASPRAIDAFPARVWRLRDAVQGARPALCTQRALLVTEYFRDLSADGTPTADGTPALAGRAGALQHILRQWRPRIWEDELLVGNFSGHRVGGSLLPELHGVAMLEDLFTFDQRDLNPLALGRQERWDLATEVLPYWLSRFLVLKAFPLPRALGFALDQLRGRRYLINETGGISHLVPDYARLLAQGTRGIAAEARERALDADDSQRDFYRAVEQVCLGLEQLASSYARQAREQADHTAKPEHRKELEDLARICERVPRLPARTLQEAFQSLLFAQIALNLESLDNSVCPGRLDQVLLPYYEADRRAGRTDAQARELIGCFTVKLSEIVPVFSRRLTRFHGGLFNGQVVVVGGTDRKGRDATNPLTWMFLDAMEQLRMRQPNYHARLHPDSPPAYVERIARMLRAGTGAPSLMNDAVVVPLLEGRGMATEDARDYSPVGCIEPVAAAATYGSTDAALVNVALCLEQALSLAKDEDNTGDPDDGPVTACRTLEDLRARFGRRLLRLTTRLLDDLGAIERANAEHHPTPLTSALLRGCLASGRDASAGGAQYNASGIQAVGAVDVADSLAALDHVLFRRGLTDWRTLLRALRSNFRGYEALRGHLLSAPKYGNHDPRADDHLRWVMEHFAALLAHHKNTRGGDYLAGFYSVTSHVAFGETTGALPSGRLATTPLTNGLSPGNGLDRLGPTAALGSAATLPLVRTARNGVNVNLKLDPSPLAGPRGLAALEGLIRGYFAQGGMQVQLNVLDPSVLEAARADPTANPWLLVRVSGYSAYFNDLSPAMQQDLIDRSLHCSR